ncbi:hypothetical protein [Flavobacterium geliluteum]|uniref:Uncharacterized protein n=1 Tax=Flavobacterium geliluteum TaxID=2816120 RepID=A0A940X4W4_9FLAO|nr:hypothetical protein [Flavobacterium geliluteum]MBP4137148.1 hypothetical protein [Flavobacterium geliluteum]
MSEFISKVVEYSPIWIIAFFFAYSFISSRTAKMKQNESFRKYEFLFNSKVKNVLKLIVFIPVTFIACVLLEFTVRTLGIYFEGNIDNTYPKNDSEAIRFFCNCIRLITITSSAFVFIPTKHKGINFLFGFLYLFIAFLLPNEIHVSNFTIVIYKGFTSFIGGLFGILVTGFIISYEDEFYKSLINKKPL